MEAEGRIKHLIKKSLEELGVNVDFSQIFLTIPKNTMHGDFTSNVALMHASKVSLKPIDFAKQIASKINDSLIEKIEVVMPGFINITVAKNVYDALIKDIIQYDSLFGRQPKNNQRVNIEFVSANPTGELHLGHARGAAIGDAVARLLEFNGYEVTREYYVNDAGNQINNLAKSLRSRYLDLHGIKNRFPKEGYHSSDLIDIAKDFDKKYGEQYLKTKDLKIFGDYAKTAFLKRIKKVLKSFNIVFDVYSFETKIRKDQVISDFLESIKQYTYEEEGALFLKTSSFLDTKDRVIRKSNGDFTYLLPDIIYHLDKLSRGYDQLIDVLGADHHGYINRMKSALMMKGYSENILDILIIQMVRLIKDGKEIKMSKRTGDAFLMKQLIKDVGADATRYFFLEKSASSHLDFNLTLAMDKTTKNPLYYIEYAHARLSKMDEKGESFGYSHQTDLLLSPSEIALLKCLNEFEKEAKDAARDKNPSKMTNYLQRLATLVHSFYTKNIVLDSENKELSLQRLGLVKAAKIILKNGLEILGIKAYNKM